jgi:2-polyprenyl-3-methyl-5-hydroxy-6-metoxy-1,4-benzoquinol methylase
VEHGGERQVAASLDNIRPDHVARYELAATYIQPKSRVLDMACGVGYGSSIIASQTDCESVLSIDISDNAIDYATKHYSHPKITYRCGDCLESPLEPEWFDIAVVFETIEHVQEYPKLLTRVQNALRPGGRLILSTPNQLHLPYNKKRFPFHVRHFTPDELQDTLAQAGFGIVSVFAQPERKKKVVVDGWEGVFNIVVCEKPVS